MAFTDGSKLRARASLPIMIGKSSKQGTPYVEFYFEITDGENKGGRVRWTGYFTPASAQRTIESLQYCGWKGEDVGEFSDGTLHGLDANEVQIVIELEEYEKDGESRDAPRVRWVNKLGGGYLNVKNAMDRGEAAEFGAKMRGLVLKSRAKSADTGTDFPPKEDAKESAPAKKAGGKRGW